MYFTSLKGYLNKKEVYIFTFTKLVLLPVLVLLMFSKFVTFFPGKLDTIIISVLVLLSSMPAMANVVIMAKIFGADDKLATANVFVSTIVSLLSLPLILLMIEMMLPA